MGYLTNCFNRLIIEAITCEFAWTHIKLTLLTNYIYHWYLMSKVHTWTFEVLCMYLYELLPPTVLTTWWKLIWYYWVLQVLKWNFSRFSLDIKLSPEKKLNEAFYLKKHNSWNPQELPASSGTLQIFCNTEPLLLVHLWGHLSGKVNKLHKSIYGRARSSYVETNVNHQLALNSHHSTGW